MSGNFFIPFSSESGPLYLLNNSMGLVPGVYRGSSTFSSRHFFINLFFMFCESMHRTLMSSMIWNFVLLLWRFEPGALLDSQKCCLYCFRSSQVNIFFLWGCAAKGFVGLWGHPALMTELVLKLFDLFIELTNVDCSVGCHFFPSPWQVTDPQCSPRVFCLSTVYGFDPARATLFRHKRLNSIVHGRNTISNPPPFEQYCPASLRAAAGFICILLNCLYTFICYLAPRCVWAGIFLLTDRGLALFFLIIVFSSLFFKRVFGFDCFLRSKV